MRMQIAAKAKAKALTGKGEAATATNCEPLGSRIKMAMFAPKTAAWLTPKVPGEAISL